jgi:hypothetical protein
MVEVIWFILLVEVTVERDRLNYKWKSNIVLSDR